MQLKYHLWLYALSIVSLVTPLSAQKNNQQINQGMIELIDQVRYLEQETRNLRGEIESLRNEQLTLKSDITTLKASISQLSTPTLPQVPTTNTIDTKIPASSPHKGLDLDLILPDGRSIKSPPPSQPKIQDNIDPAAELLFKTAKEAFEHALYDDSKTAFLSFLDNTNAAPQALEAQLYLAKIAIIQQDVDLAIQYLKSIKNKANNNSPLMPEVESMLSEIYVNADHNQEIKIDEK